MPRLQHTIVPKLWGSEQWVVNSPLYCAKFLHLLPGYQCSLHYHPVKDETFHVLEGTVMLETPGNLEALAVGDTYHLPPMTPHRFFAYGGPATILEISTTHSDEDVVRLEESRAI